jgi:hypothetical protein
VREALKHVPLWRVSSSGKLPPHGAMRFGCVAHVRRAFADRLAAA